MDPIALVLIVSAAAFLLLCIVWSKSGWLNTFLKIFFALLAIANGIAALSQLGWMIQIPGSG